MKKKGSALVATLVIIALLTVLTVSVVKVTSSTSTTNVKFDDTYNLKLAAESGIIKGFSDLKTNYSKYSNASKKKNTDADINTNPSFTTADGKYICTVTIYNYNKNNESDNSKYTIESIAKTLDNKHSKTVTAFCEKVIRPVSTATASAFYNTLVNNAISLIGVNNEQVASAKGSKRKTFLNVTNGTNSYIQGTLPDKGLSVSDNVNETLNGKIIMPSIKTGNANKYRLKNGTDLKNSTWTQLGNDNIGKNIYVYKSEQGTDMYSIMAGGKNIKSDFFTDTNIIKVILVAGDLCINVGRAQGNTEYYEQFNRCIILSTGTIFTEKNKSGAKFTKCSVAGKYALDNNKTQYSFTEEIHLDTASAPIVEEFITKNIEGGVGSSTSTDELTNIPKEDLVYVN